MMGWGRTLNPACSLTVWQASFIVSSIEISGILLVGMVQYMGDVCAFEFHQSKHCRHFSAISAEMSAKESVIWSLHKELVGMAKKRGFILLGSSHTSSNLSTSFRSILLMRQVRVVTTVSYLSVPSVSTMRVSSLRNLLSDRQHVNLVHNNPRVNWISPIRNYEYRISSPQFQCTWEEQSKGGGWEGIQAASSRLACTPELALLSDPYRGTRWTALKVTLIRQQTLYSETLCTLWLINTGILCCQLHCAWY